MLQMENYQGNTKYNLLEDKDIVDNLTTTATNKALSANQGKVLNDKITKFKKTLKAIAVGTVIRTMDSTGSTKIFEDNEINEMLGVSDTNKENTGVFVTNGDRGIYNTNLFSTGRISYSHEPEAWWAYSSSALSGTVRLQYMIFYWGGDAE